jgi:hypothetical protein
VNSVVKAPNTKSDVSRDESRSEQIMSSPNSHTRFFVGFADNIQMQIPIHFSMSEVDRKQTFCRIIYIIYLSIEKYALINNLHKKLTQL